MISDLTEAELVSAPERVQRVIMDLPEGTVRFVEVDEESQDLCERYLKAGVVAAGSRSDALHVATATVCGAPMMVSWNFKHLVHFEKIRGFNAVNLNEGYGRIDLFSPLEVI